MADMKAELIYHTPLWLVERAGRKSHNSLDKLSKRDICSKCIDVDYDSIEEDCDCLTVNEAASKWIKSIGHDALLKHGDLVFDLTMPRTVLLEFEKHVIGMCTPTDVMADINQSTRYTLTKLLKVLNRVIDDMNLFPHDLFEFLSNNILGDADGITCKYLIEKRINNMDATPDEFKQYLPENWMVSGQYKISLLTMKNIIKQRYDGTTGKPHYLIKELVGKMIDCLPDYILNLVK